MENQKYDLGIEFYTDADRLKDLEARNLELIKSLRKRTIALIVLSAVFAVTMIILSINWGPVTLLTTSKGTLHTRVNARVRDVLFDNLPSSTVHEIEPKIRSKVNIVFE